MKVLKQLNRIFSHVQGRVILFCMALFMATGAAAVESASGLSAEEAVDAYVEELLGKLEGIQEYYDNDRDRYFEEIEAALDDFINFREVARGVMAKYSTGPRGASDEQLDRFAEVFKSSVVDFYGTALASYGGEGYEIVGSRESSNPENATNVRMRVLGKDGDRFELQYTMFLNEDREWQLKNLYVEGVNMRRQYHSQFDNLMSRHDYDIDAAIDNWAPETEVEL